MIPEIQRPESDFAIEIGFEPETGFDPARVFKSMGDLIDAFQDMDRQLIRSIDSSIKPILMLEDIEAGSLRTWLRSQLTTVDDDVLKQGDWKKVLGLYLVKAKHIIVRWLDGRTVITSAAEVAELEQQLLNAAEETDVRRIPLYQPIERGRLLNGIQEISTALAHLEQPDSASLITSDGSVEFNLNFRISDEAVEALSIEERISHQEEMILKVKRPDFLGEAKWEFVYERAIEAKMADREWLQRFQAGDEQILPGDSIRALVQVDVKYGFDQEVVNKEYCILRVLRVIHRERPEQRLLGE